MEMEIISLQSCGGEGVVPEVPKLPAELEGPLEKAGAAQSQGLGRGSVLQHLPSIYRVLGYSLSTAKTATKIYFAKKVPVRSRSGALQGQSQ